MLIEEVTGELRRPGPRAAVARNVDPSGWGTYTVRLRIGGGQRWYVGSFRTAPEAIAAAQWARVQRDRSKAVETPVPIITKRAPAPVEAPSYSTFGR